MNKTTSNTDTMMRTIIAIDPGKSGGIVFMRGPEITTHALKNKTDSEIVSILREGADPLTPPAVAYMEKVGGYIPKGEDGEGQPGSRMFTFGESYGFLRGVLEALQIPLVLVMPQMWQRGIPGRGGSYSERKGALRDHAAKLFPEIDVTRDIADALGILHYARFKETGANAGYVAKRALPGIREQFALAEAWCKACGWPVPAKGTPERSAMVDHWANLYLNGEA